MTFRVAHGSRQAEAGAERQVELELACVAVEEVARSIAAAPLGIAVQLAGFLAPKGKSTRTPVLHATQIEFIEGAGHASTQQG